MSGISNVPYPRLWIAWLAVADPSASGETIHTQGERRDYPHLENQTSVEGVQMIRIKFISGEFKIANGVLIDGGSAVRNLFEQAQLEPIPVSGGPVDYVLAMRIVKLFGNDYEILESSDMKQYPPDSVS